MDLNEFGKFFSTEPTLKGVKSDSSSENGDVPKIKIEKSSNSISKSKKVNKQVEFDYNFRAPLSGRREKQAFPPLASKSQVFKDNLYSPRGRTVIDRNTLLANIKVPVERKKLPTKQDIKQYKKEVKGLIKPNHQYSDTTNEIYDRRVLDENVLNNSVRIVKKPKHLMNDITEPVNIYQPPKAFPLHSIVKSRDLCGIPNSLSFIL